MDAQARRFPESGRSLLEPSMQLRRYSSSQVHHGTKNRTPFRDDWQTLFAHKVRRGDE